MEPGKIVMLAAGAAALGGVAGAMAVGLTAGSADRAESAATEVRELREERQDLFSRLEALEKKRPRASDRPRSSDEPGASAAEALRVSRAMGAEDDPARHAITGPLADGTLGGPDDVDQAFVDRVRAAIETIRRENREANAEGEQRRKREKYLNGLDKRLSNYKDRLGLTDPQVADLGRLAERAFDERAAAQVAGATGDELASMDRETARVSQGLMGQETYREFRKLELDRAARPIIVDAAIKAGVDQEQRDQIETLLTRHIEKVVEWDVRVRTDDLPGDERERIMTEYRNANRDAWDRLRSDILTEEQRQRVPIRLR